MPPIRKGYVINQMNQPTPVTALTLISRGIQIYKLNLPLYIKITLVCMLFPQILHQLFFAFSANNIVLTMKDSVTKLTQAPSWESLLTTDIVKFIYLYVGSYMLLGFWFLVGYFAIIDNTIQWQKTQVSHSLSTALKKGLKFVLPKGFILGLFIGCMGLLSNLILPPMILIFVLTLMIPILLVAEGTSIFTTIKNAMFLRYAPVIVHLSGPWRTFFTLSGVVGFFYIAVILHVYMIKMISELETVLPQFIWRETLSGFPFSFLQLLQQILLGIGNALLISLLPVVCVQLYLTVRLRVVQKV